MDEDIKRCSKCEILSLKSFFHKNKLTKDGYRSARKVCGKKIIMKI